jgi:DNA-binding transcriptional LysR family regulator
MMSKGKEISVGVHGRFKADNGVALVEAALAGLGICVVPDFLIDAHVASGALVPVLVNHPPPEGGIFVVRPPGPFPPRKVRALIEIMIERFG